MKAKTALSLLAVGLATVLLLTALLAPPLHQVGRFWHSETPQAARGIEVAVAKKSLPAMSVVRASDFVRQRVSRNDVSPSSGRIADPATVTGRTLAQPVVEGQVLTDNLFAPEGSVQQLLSQLPPGGSLVVGNPLDKSVTTVLGQGGSAVLNQGRLGTYGSMLGNSAAAQKDWQEQQRDELLASGPLAGTAPAQPAPTARFNGTPRDSTGMRVSVIRGKAHTEVFSIRQGHASVSTRQVPAILANVCADEIWVIARPKVQATSSNEDTPGCGAILAKLPKEAKEIPLPLKHTDVKGQISGYIATVDVTQQFHNPYDQKIEAVYVFPLPQNAAINEFIMTIGERHIRGIIRERKEAEEIYRQARSQGYVASLLTQERPNIFKQKVANIEPGKAIDVNIKYFNTLAYVDGWYEFVFPMVVGPRFNPPCYMDGVGAVARGKNGVSGQKTEVQYLKPCERSGHDISLALDIDAGVTIEQVVCPSHVISKSFPTPETLTVKLSSLDSIPNKDFVLRYKVAGKTVKSALVTHRDKRGGFFTFMLYPPESLSYLKRAPMEMIFVLDCSGSMSGKPIAKAKQAITRALKKLQPDDTFQVIRFSNRASQLGPDPLPATPENIRKALAYVQSLRGSGGTMMIEGINAALDFAHDPHRLRLVSFMTDGYIGNEAEILDAVYQRLGASRIFSFGVGSSVNRYLLDRMAKLGRGAVAYIGLDESVSEVVDLFYDRISHPALADVAVDWGDMKVTDVFPSRIPDLFVGRPIILTGRFKGQNNTTIRVTGKVGDLTQEIDIPVNLNDSRNVHPGITCVWARKKIETLANQAVYDTNTDLPGQIKQVALNYGLMSAYTAFIAVDSSRTTAGDHGITVPVPVPVPHGVRYDTTVQN
jgi:Ca-activated chloride channel homolog